MSLPIYTSFTDAPGFVGNMFAVLLTNLSGSCRLCLVLFTAFMFCSCLCVEHMLSVLFICHVLSITSWLIFSLLISSPLYSSCVFCPGLVCLLSPVGQSCYSPAGINPNKGPFGLAVIQYMFIPSFV